AARISHFEVLKRVLDLGPSVAVFRAFYTRIYSDGLFSFTKRSLSAPSCLSKPPDSIKNWADHFFWVDSRVFPIFVPLYTGGILEKDPAPHLTARQEQAVQVQKGEEQVTLLESIKHCFVSLDAPAAVHQASGSGSSAGPKVSAPSAGENVVAEENVIPMSTYVDLVDPEGDLTVVEKGDAAQNSRIADAPVYTTADTMNSSRDAKRWYIPRWNITNDSLLDDGFSCRTLVDHIYLGSKVRSRTEHELELKEKLRAKYDARGVLLREKDVEIARLKSLVNEKETESAEVLRLRD
ncbi:hypothetical protein Tco_1072677, partial [Tanacetum coccineum]